MSGWNLTGETLPNEEKANKAISDVQFKSTPFNGDVAGWQEAKANKVNSDVQFKSTPFNGDVHGWQDDEKERERIAVKGIEDAYKKDYARFKQENPGVDPGSVSKIFEEIMKEEKAEQGRTGGMRR